MKKFKRYVLASGLIAIALNSVSGTKEYISSSEVLLPPESERRVIGTWLQDKLMGGWCTHSFEEVKSLTYRVIRCDDGSGGKHGVLLKKVSAKKYLSTTTTAGDYYVILKDGNLERRDKDGHIDIQPRHRSPWPDRPTIPRPH